MRIWLMAAAIVLAGCAESGPPGGDGDGTGDGPGAGGDGPGTGFAPQEGHDEARDPAVPGVVLEGDLVSCDAGICIGAEARNEGDVTYHVSAICVSPWSERMEQEGQPVAHREPTFHCLAFGTKPFAPGDHQEASFAWNGTLWDDPSTSYEAAPDGVYQWSVTFHLYEQADGQGFHTLEVEFTLVVGAT